MYFVKKLVVIRCTRSALSLSLFSLSLSLQSNVLQANLASTVWVILKIAVKGLASIRPFSDRWQTQVFWSCWELQAPWRWRLLHFPCLLQLPMFVPYNPRCSNLNCIVVCYLRESARESSLFFGPLPSRPSFLVIWGSPFELLLFFMRRSVSVLRKNAIFAENFTG
jgi:hypothetical protein